jgi:hypothetical protein
MKIKYIKGFYYDGLLYGWKDNKLYRLPKFKGKRMLPLKELKPMKVGNKVGYSFNGRKKSITQLEAITTDINYIYEKIIHEDCTF